jgi:hypothetical protein
MQRRILDLCALVFAAVLSGCSLIAFDTKPVTASDNYGLLMAGGQYSQVDAWLRAHGAALFNQSQAAPCEKLKLIQFGTEPYHQVALEIERLKLRPGGYADLVRYGYLMATDMVPEPFGDYDIVAIGSPYFAAADNPDAAEMYQTISLRSETNNYPYPSVRQKYLQNVTSGTQLTGAHTYYLVVLP